MKKFLFGTIICLVCVFLGSSCRKEDDADAFVGIYDVRLTENVTWGNASGTTTDTGVFCITKESSTRVKLTGYISTYGNVYGNIIQLETTTSSDLTGTLTSIYSPGTLSGNVLLITANTTGRLISNGIYYPFSSIESFTCIKRLSE